MNLMNIFKTSSDNSVRVESTYFFCYHIMKNLNIKICISLLCTHVRFSLSLNLWHCLHFLIYNLPIRVCVWTVKVH